MSDEVVVAPSRVARFEPVDGDRHGASAALNRWVREQGWSIGPSCTAGRRGIMFGDATIAKWHNLSALEQAQCDAVAIGRAPGPFVVVVQDQAGVPQPGWKTWTR